MICTTCGGNLVPLDLLADQPETHRFFSKAELIGFSNPNGFRCENSAHCTSTYARDADGALQLLLVGVRHDYRDDVSDGEVWEIVDYWEMVSGAVLKDDEDAFPLPTSDDVEDEIIRNDAKYWLDHDIRAERFEPEDGEPLPPPSRRGGMTSVGVYDPETGEYNYEYWPY